MFKLIILEATLIGLPRLGGQSLRVFVALAIAQLVADFVWQTDEMVRQKQEAIRVAAAGNWRRFVGYTMHGAVLLAASIVLVSPWWSGKVVTAVLIVTIAHLILDYLKCRYVSKATVSIILTDQLLHLVVILGVFTFLGLAEWHAYRPWMEETWRLYKGAAAAIFSGYVISIWVGAVLVRAFLDTLGSTQKIDEGLQNAGKRIGQFERFLVTTLTVLDQYGAIAFVFAAKSIARFKKMEDEPTFAEYYLAGTFASVSFGVLIGLCIKGGLAILWK